MDWRSLRMGTSILVLILHGFGSSCDAETTGLDGVRFENEPAATPTLSLAGGTYSTSQSVTISDSTPGALIYYTTDGNTPNRNSTVYRGAITVSSSETLKAIAMAFGYSTSAVASASYAITARTASRTFSVASGVYSTPLTVSIAEAVPGTTIYYTTDGSTPTKSSTVYTGPINVSTTETLKAIAMAPGYTNSAIATATYTIQPAAPDFSVAVSSGTLTVVQGQSTTTNLTVTPENGFNSVVSFSCSGLPAGTSCSFSPPTVTPTGAAASTALTVSASQASADLRHGSGPLIPGSTLAVALCCLGVRRRRLSVILLLVTVAVGPGLVLLTGCGASPALRPATSAVTSAVTVTASSGSLQHAASFSLTLN